MNSTGPRPPIRLGISTCPNDTFAFCALMNRWVDWRGLEFDVQLADIQALNEQLDAGQLDVGKASFHAALWLADRYVVLPAGAALGFGVGPLLLAAQSGAAPRPEANDDRVLTLCPGRWTTASLLYGLYYPRASRIEQVVFSEIMPALQSRRADFGVCIHEGRFTFQRFGLTMVEDLGTRWEQETGHPLPLGGIVGSRRLPSDVLRTINAVIADSLQRAWEAPELTLPTLRRYASEMGDDVLMQHVQLYVNEWTLDLGATGRQALKELSKRSRATLSIPTKRTALEVLE